MKAAVIEESSIQSLSSNHIKGEETQTDWLFLSKNSTHNNLKFSNLQPSNTVLDQKPVSLDTKSSGSPVDTSEKKKELARGNSL